MKNFLIFFGLPILAVIIFFSGSMPYTLIYDEASLRDVEHTGDEPVSVEVVRCDIQNAGDLQLGDILDTNFRASLANNTDRYVVVSAIGEVFDPAGRSSAMHSQMMILSPNATEETSFRSRTPYIREGSYRCEMRWAVGRL